MQKIKNISRGLLWLSLLFLLSVNLSAEQLTRTGIIDFISIDKAQLTAYIEVNGIRLAKKKFRLDSKKLTVWYKNRRVAPKGLRSGMKIRFITTSGIVKRIVVINSQGSQFGLDA